MDKSDRNLKCPFCDGDLIWNSDCDVQELCDDYDEDDTAIASYYLCSRCGRDYEIIEPKEEDRMGEYKEYWSKE